MDILCYILGGLSVAFGILTAILYVGNKPNKALITKMTASTFFIAAGIAALSSSFHDKTASALIVMGMLLSFWGDFFLAKKETSKLGSSNNFALGVLSFALSQIVFVVGFLMMEGFEFNFYFLFLLLLGVIPLVGGKITKMLSFKGNELYLSLVYSLLLCLTLAVTASNYYYNASTSNLIAMIGAVMFVVSDFSLGLYFFSSLKWKKLFNYPIMLFYFGAEIMYALCMIV